MRVYTPGASEPLATGVLDFVDSAVDTAPGTIAAKAKFANENFELWPGMYVDVEIDLDVRPKTVMIPTVAIQSGQKGRSSSSRSRTGKPRCARSSSSASKAIARRSCRA